MCLKTLKIVALLMVFALGFGCPGCSDEVGLERDFFEAWEMYPHDFDGQPAIDGPERLLFLDLQVGQRHVESATLQNVGRTGLFIDEFAIDGPFDLDVPEDFDGADRLLRPGESVEVRVGYTAVDEEPRQGVLTVFSNDPGQPEFDIELLANVEVPCLEIEPAEILNFGEVEQGHSATRRIYVTNCGGQQLQVELTDFESDDGFELVDPDRITRQIDAGSTEAIEIRFRPGQIRAYRGSITFVGRGYFDEEATVELHGVGASPPCPQAVISATSEQETVVADPTGTIRGFPLEVVPFHGEESVAVGGSIEAYEWSLVEKPQDTFVSLGQPADSPTNDLYLELSGTYVVELHVWDDQGIRSCEPARLTVEAVSADAIHLQLVWDTPTDPDPHNNSGTDLDLHFLHENGQWNTSPWDCYWLNMNPNWGDPENDDMNPRLDIDDVTGWGPENINLLIPEEGVRYGVGVYYFSDHGYGPSYATVRIFLYGQSVLELEGRYMEDGDFWHVADIDWPSQQLLIRDQVMGGFPP